MKKYEVNGEQLELLYVKEEGENKKPAKRVDIVSIKMVKERSMMYKNRQISSPEDAYQLFKEYLDGVDREWFVVAALNTKNEPTVISTAHIGTLNSSIVHPREIMKLAVLSNASSIVVCHPHPSGNPEPSQEDIHVTRRLVEASKIMGIDLLDHIILGDDKFVSLKEKGYI